jgi:hypothetical protein
MVDKRIGAWWSRRLPNEPQFSWDAPRTVISPTKKSFEAYLAWTYFCRKRAGQLSGLSEKAWRARDVEMAVWTDTSGKLPLA